MRILPLLISKKRMSRLTIVVFPHRWTNNGHLLSGLNLGREILDNDFVRIVGIAETDMLEGDGAFDLLRSVCLTRFVLQLLFLKKAEDPVPAPPWPTAYWTFPAPGYLKAR